MKAVIIETFGGPEVLKLSDVPKPSPTDSEAQVKVVCVGVNPVDWKIREGHLKERLPHEFPIILGWDAAGTVSALGKDAHGFNIGDEVFGYFRKPKAKWGTYAEYSCIEAKNLARKPKNISFAEAAAIPLAGLTAWQSLFDAAKLKASETILIHGAGGGVGSLAVQFAKYAHAKVIATASGEKEKYVKGLGADVVIDYTKQDVSDVIKRDFPKGLDVVFDTIGGNVYQSSMDLLKPGGRLVSILVQADPAEAKRRNISLLYVFVSPNGSQLQQISDLISQDIVKPPHITTMPLEQVAEAHRELQSGHMKGKFVLQL